MAHSERVRKRALRLKLHIKDREARKPHDPDLPVKREALNRLISGKKPSRPVGAIVHATTPRRRKK